MRVQHFEEILGAGGEYGELGASVNHEKGKSWMCLPGAVSVCFEVSPADSPMAPLKENPRFAVRKKENNGDD